MISPFISLKFRFWAFISMVLLVFVHGYNLDLRYLQPWTTPGEPLTITGFIEYFLANGIFRFRIPMLFIISGYLYAWHDQKPNDERMNKRLRTLLIPYLAWSAFGIAMTYALELFPYTKGLLEQSRVVQIDSTRLLLHDYHWYELLTRWIVIPVSYQLWFIRVLLVYNFAYPAIRWCVQNEKARWVFFGFAFLLWLGTLGFVFVEGEGLLFFSLGVWMQKNDFSIEAPRTWLRPMTWSIVFVGLATLKTFLAFNGMAIMGKSVYPVIVLLHKAVVISGLITCWYGFDPVVKWCMTRPWFVWLSAFSFIIYAMHAPLVAIAINGMFSVLQPIQGYQLITFFLLPTIIIALCILTGVLLRAIAPKVYSVLTGGRGF
jgi:fucose 4-O-acetylase-like acetyltransferase